MANSAAQPIIESMSRDHSAALMGWARSRFADQRDAEEVVAETLVRAWHRFDQFDPSKGTERAWLFGIARNAAVDHYRKSKRHLRSIPVAEPTDSDPLTDCEIDRLVETSHVRDALGALSDEHSSAVIDAYFNGQTTTEIARDRHIPVGTVKSRLHYALKAMRSQLEERGVLQ